MASGRVGARTAARISLARPLSPPASAHATATPPRRPHTWASNPQRRLEQAVRLRVGHSLPAATDRAVFHASLRLGRDTWYKIFESSTSLPRRRQEHLSQRHTHQHGDVRAQRGHVRRLTGGLRVGIAAQRPRAASAAVPRARWPHRTFPEHNVGESVRVAGGRAVPEL